MKQVTIRIPDNKFQFVMDLLHNLPYIKVEKPQGTFLITEEQKVSAEEEFRKMETNPDYALDWDKVKHLIKVD